MNRRAFKRTETHLPVKYFCESSIYTGTIKNISENGMCIFTSNFLPCSNSLEIHMPLQEEVSQLYVKIRRIEKVNDSELYVGIEVINPPKNYIDFVESLNSSGSSHDSLQG